MKSRFKVLGHPAHPTLVVFPLAFYPLAALSEVIYLVLRFFNYQNSDRILNFDAGFFWRAGFFMLVIGLLGQGAASLPGTVDWLNIPNAAPSKDKATFHLVVAIILGGIAFMALLLLNWGEPPATLRFPDDLPLMVGVGLNIFNGLILATYQGWLGGELVYRHGIGVEQADSIDPITVTPGSERIQENV
ncbi:MAG TPA: DUF2231 domain-containing protein [Chloroflexia bacterium]|nr:DUF2231 domain-containing protein [Chloroflexia bacterium]